jgi:2-keto-4-pentenoate hydratase
MGLGCHLPPRRTVYDALEVLAAVEALHRAIKMTDSRFEDFAVVGAPQLIADNACANLFVLAPEATMEWRGMDLAEHTAVGRVSGRTERLRSTPTEPRSVKS